VSSVFTRPAFLASSSGRTSTRRAGLNGAIIISWSTWLDKIRSRKPEGVPELIDRELALEPLNDEAEIKALKHSVQSFDEPIIFLESDGRKIVAYRFDGDWILRRHPEAIPGAELYRLIEYTLGALACLRQTLPRPQFGDYYSLNPLIYGGEYWLGTVCRQEISRYREDERATKLSVLIVPWSERGSLFEFVKSLRRGDRIGYFGQFLGVVLPYTGKPEMRVVIDRMKETFGVNEIRFWEMERDFGNYHELKTRVNKLR